MNDASKSIDLLAWASAQVVRVLKTGRALAHWQTADAQQVGVRFPRRVRVLLVNDIPAPGDPELRAAAESSGLLDASGEHLTLGYAILIDRRNVGSRRVLRHALGAVAEFELAGSLHSFLSGYLDPMVGPDIPTPGPPNDDLKDAGRRRPATADFPRGDQIPSRVRSASSPKSVSAPFSSE